MKIKKEEINKKRADPNAVEAEQKVVSILLDVKINMQTMPCRKRY